VTGLALLILSCLPYLTLNSGHPPPPGPAAARAVLADGSGRGEQDVKDWGRETPLADAVSRAPAGAALGDTRETTAAAAASADRGSDQAAPIGFFCVRAVQP
jgi:hypothetical protein